MTANCFTGDEVKRRQIRENYRNLLTDIKENKQELINLHEETNQLTVKLRNADKYFGDVYNPREGTLDSTSLFSISELGKYKAESLKPDFITFNCAEFCQKLRVLIGGDARVDSEEDESIFTHKNWQTLGHTLCHFLKKTPTLKYMYGSFDKSCAPLQKIKQTRERNKEDNEKGKATIPTQLSAFDNMDRGELTTAQVEHLLETLNSYYKSEGNEPICFFEFVTNPHSFGQTVENIFYVSFLVRDGYAEIRLDSDNLPVILPILDREDRGETEANSTKNQVVMSITPAEWQEIVRTFNIEEPIIKELTLT